MIVGDIFAAHALDQFIAEVWQHCVCVCVSFFYVYVSACFTACRRHRECENVTLLILNLFFCLRYWWSLGTDTQNLFSFSCEHQVLCKFLKNRFLSLFCCMCTAHLLELVCSFEVGHSAGVSEC